MVTHYPAANGESHFNQYPYFAPRIWHGMSARTWFKLAKENQFKFSRIDMAACVTFFSFWNSIGNRLGGVLYKRRAAALPLVDDPLFIIGHWRTGTTLLHTLLAKDNRNATPNSYQVFTPRHFILTEPWVTKLLHLPRRRPMDNMDMAWTEPQEDEYAVCINGLPSIYLNWAFPKHKKRHLETLDIDACAPRTIEKYKQVTLDFVKMLNFKYRLPLVLKSPPNTGRVRMLLELFPNAKFVHLTRSPFDFVPSTLHLSRVMDKVNGFQARDENLSEQDEENYVFDCFRRMYEGFNRQKSAIPPRNFCELRYDDLTSNPVSALREVYEQLRLPDFEHVASKIDQHMQSERDYKRNQHALSPELEARIVECCGGYLEQYNYPPGQTSSGEAVG